MRRTISGMIGAGSLAHNRRDFVAENVDPDRVHLNICYQNENLKEVYKELFDDSVERYNVGKRKDRQITNYYEKIRQGKQEKLFHEAIFQIGNMSDCGCGTPDGERAAAALKDFAESFAERNPHLRVFNMVLHMDEATAGWGCAPRKLSANFFESCRRPFPSGGAAPAVLQVADLEDRLVK